MSSDPLVDGYASAIFEVARAEEVLDEVEDELFRFSRLLDQQGELRMALTDSTRPPEQRQQMIEELLDGKVSAPTLMLVGFVVGSGRAAQLSEIVASLLNRVASEKRRVVAEVTSAVPLDEDQRQRLAAALSSATDKEVDLHVMIDPSILGGLVAKVGDQLIDGSIIGRLARMREQIEAARVS